MNDISGVSGTSSINQIAGTGSSMSVEDVMAMLFLRRAETLSGLATDRAQQEQGKLDDLNDARGMLAKMSALKKQAGKKDKSDMPSDMKAFCDEHRIDYDHTGNDDTHNKDEWGVNIQYLNTYIDKLSSNNDTFMIKLKSLVGKATNATEGANNVVTQKKQIMKDILTSFGR